MDVTQLQKKIIRSTSYYLGITCYLYRLLGVNEHRNRSSKAHASSTYLLVSEKWIRISVEPQPQISKYQLKQTSIECLIKHVQFNHVLLRGLNTKELDICLWLQLYSLPQLIVARHCVSQRSCWSVLPAGTQKAGSDQLQETTELTKTKARFTKSGEMQLCLSPPYSSFQFLKIDNQMTANSRNKMLLEKITLFTQNI